MLGSSLVSSLVRENASPQITSYVARFTDLLAWFQRNGRVLPIGGDSDLTWNINYSGNGSFEVFVEGQASPAAGRQSYVKATASPFYARTACAVTGHVRDKIRNGGLLVDAEKAEIAGATSELYTGAEAQLVGSTASRGIAAIVDSTGTTYSVNPSTITLHSSYENTSGGALGFSLLETMYETLVLRGANPDVMFANINQINNYLALAAPNGMTGHAIANADGGVSAVDYGKAKAKVSYNGMPLEMIRALVNTELYMLSSGTPEDMCVRETRPLQVDKLGRANDADRAEVSWAGALIIKNRYHQAKATGLTA